MKMFRPYTEKTREFRLQIAKILQKMNEVGMSAYVAKENFTSYEHGLKVSYSTVDQDKKEMEMQRIEASSVVPFDRIKRSDFSLLPEILGSLHEQFMRTTVARLFEVLEEATEEAGNKIDGGGKPLSAEHLLAMYDKVEMGLSKDGTLAIPRVHLHPSMMEKVKEVMNSDPEFKKKLDQILEKKFAEAKRAEAERISKFPINRDKKQ